VTLSSSWERKKAAETTAAQTKMGVAFWSLGD